MGKLVTYSAVADYDGTDYIGEHWTSKVAVENVSDERLALQHARAMKAVLLAAKAWERSCRAENPSVDFEAKMLVAVNQLAKIEKEVSRG